MSKIDELTAGELAIAERKAGVAITALEDPNTPKIGLLTALAWMVMKREDGKATFADAESKNLSQIMDILGLNDDSDEEDPKE